MAGLMIRLNEAELLRAGMPRESVVALREIVKIIGSGFSSGDLGDIEGLILTASREDAATSNLRADMDHLSQQVGMIRRDFAGQFFALRGEIDALRERNRTVNLTGIEDRLSQLEHLTAGL